MNIMDIHLDSPLLCDDYYRAVKGSGSSGLRGLSSIQLDPPTGFNAPVTMDPSNTPTPQWINGSLLWPPLSVRLEQTDPAFSCAAKLQDYYKLQC